MNKYSRSRSRARIRFRSTARRTRDIIRRFKLNRYGKIFILAALILVLSITIVATVTTKTPTIEPGAPPILESAAPKSRIADIAAGELGNNFQKYCTWWGYNDHQEWCGIFVCWCADQAGYISDLEYISSINVNSDIGNPRDTGAGAGCHARFHDKQDRYKSRESGYIPKSGDLIYFDWDMDNKSEGNLVMDHIGIVEAVGQDLIYTIEGNSLLGEGTDDLVRRKSYKLSDGRISGYSDMSGITELIE